MIRSRAVFCIAAILAFATPVFAAGTESPTLEVPSGSAPLSALGISFTRVKLERNVDAAGNPHPTLELRGRFRHRHEVLALNYAPVRPDQHGKFSARIEITPETPQLSVSVVDAFGEVRETVVTVIDGRTRRFLASTDEKAVSSAVLDQIEGPPRGHELKWNLGLEAKSESYEQTGLSKFGGANLAATGTARLGLSEKFELIGYGSFDLTPIQEGDNSLRSTRWSLSAGYYVPAVQPPWSFKLALGWYYGTTVTSGDFGYANVSGPEIRPTLTRELAHGGRVMASGSLTGIMGQGQGLSLSNSELSLLAGYYFAPLSSGVFRGHRFGIVGEYRSLNIDLAPAGSAKLTTYMLGLQYAP